MKKALLLLLCLSLAGIFFISACSGAGGENQAATVAAPSSTSEKSLEPPTPTAKATSTKVVKSTQVVVMPTKTLTPTATGTLSAVDTAAEIDLLLENLIADLENSEVIQETEIP